VPIIATRMPATPHISRNFKPTRLHRYHLGFGGLSANVMHDK
jgi:hypothetical protein